MNDSAPLLGLILVAFFILVALYIVCSYPLGRIATRLGDDRAGWAWIPIAQLVLLFNLGDMSGWWALAGFALGCVPFIGMLLGAIPAAFAMSRIAKKLGHPEVLGFISMIPLVNIIILYYFAFASPGVERIG
jgi:hypothetical protein